MNEDEIYSLLCNKISKKEVDEKIKEKLKNFGGLLSREGALLIVAAEYGIKIDFEREKRVVDIGDINEEMKNVCIVGRVSEISEVREFETSGGKGKVVNLKVLDKTGECRVVLWNDIAALVSEIKKGDVLEIVDGYVRSTNFGIEVNVSKRGNIRINPEVEVELPEIHEKRMKIKDVSDGMENFDVVGKVSKIFGVREFKKRNGNLGKVARIMLMDESGEICVVLWDEQAKALESLGKGDLIKVENAYCKEGLNGLELHVSWRGRILKNPKEKVDVEIPTSKVLKISDLREENNVSVSGTIVEIFGIRTFERENGVGKIASFLMKDKTGECRVVLWNEKAELAENLMKGMKVKIEDAYTREGLDGIEVHVSGGAKVVLKEFKTLPKIRFLKEGRCEVVGRVLSNEEIVDETGRIKIKTSEKLEKGTCVLVSGNYKNGKIEVEKIENFKKDFPSLESILNPKESFDYECEYAVFSGFVKKVLKNKDNYFVLVDNGDFELWGVVFSEIDVGKDYEFKGTVKKKDFGFEFVSYDFAELQEIESAKSLISRIESIMEV